jgi:hypothetical protein
VVWADEDEEEDAFRVFEDDEDGELEIVAEGTAASAATPAGAKAAAGACTTPRWAEYVAVVTSSGRVAVVGRSATLVGDDFTLVAALQLPHTRGGGGGDLAAGEGEGAVSNSLAVDEQGGVYVVAATHLHKVVWTEASDGDRVKGVPAGNLTLAWSTR